MGAMCQGSRPTGTELGATQSGSGIYLKQPSKIKSSSISATLKMSQTCSSFVSSETAFILGCKPDQNLKHLNKFMLIALFFIEKKGASANEEIKDFITILKNIDDDKSHLEEIANFEKDYIAQKTPKEKAEFLLAQIFKNKFISQVIELFPTIFNDLTVFGYLRRPVVDIVRGIKVKYEKGKKLKEIYCVLQINDDEEKILKKIAYDKQAVTFSTFVRAFSSEAKAKNRQKQLQKLGKSIRSSHSLRTSTIFINIVIGNDKVDKDYDYGFYQCQQEKDNQMGDVVLNIMNFYQVTDSDPQSKEYTLAYNYLAKLVELKRDRNLEGEPDLLKIRAMTEAKSVEIKSYSHLLRVVGQSKDSISASQQALSMSKSSKSLVNIDDNERKNLLETHLENNEYNQALKYAGEGDPQSSVRQAQVYYEKKDYEKVDKILLDLQSKKTTLKSKDETFEEYVLYQLIYAKRKIQKGEKKTAKDTLINLRRDMEKKYKGNYEFRAREVESCISQCEDRESKIDWNKYSDGLNLGSMVSH